jgi:hypothetical protein
MFIEMSLGGRHGGREIAPNGARSKARPCSEMIIVNSVYPGGGTWTEARGVEVLY